MICRDPDFGPRVVIEFYRIRCPDCGLKIERVEQLPGKAPFSKRFEEVGGRGLRERLGAASGQTVRLGEERGTSD